MEVKKRSMEGMMMKTDHAMSEELSDQVVVAKFATTTQHVTKQHRIISDAVFLKICDNRKRGKNRPTEAVIEGNDCMP